MHSTVHYSHPRSERGTDLLVAKERSDEILNHGGPQYSSVDELMHHLAKLEAENHRLREGTEQPGLQEEAVEAYGEVMHCFGNEAYLDQPTWSWEESGPRLHAIQRIRSVQVHLYQSPGVAFVVYKDYDDNADLADDRPENTPTPYRESIAFITAEMKDAVRDFVGSLPDSSSLFPDFNVDAEVAAPYLLFYYYFSVRNSVILRLKQSSEPLMQKLLDVVMRGHEGLYRLATEQFARGFVSPKTLHFLIQPSHVVVSTRESILRGYIATSWAQKLTDEDFKGLRGADDVDNLNYLSAVFNSAERRQASFVEHPVRGKRAKRRTQVQEWALGAWSWKFSGSLDPLDSKLTLRLSFEDEDQEFRINELETYPLQYASDEIRVQLESRGKMFFRFNDRLLVEYQHDEVSGPGQTSGRYMIDMKTYNQQFQDATVTAPKLQKPDLSIVTPGKADKGRPKRDSIFVFPPTVIGFNMRSKKWGCSLEHGCFFAACYRLKTKNLIQALVVSQIAGADGTEIIAGKGNGLIVLLHGSPGTGKTFTAEAIAEYAKKPLYQVTSGDIGNDPEATARYLETISYLGRTWDCVVLLEEADVLLQERTLTDLRRNTLVSTFLHWLDYYDGFLFLTSNRVGTFDEAFRSRIHLALQYPRFSGDQRQKIWANIISRLRDMEDSNIDFQDIMDHIHELGKWELNGREIRNAITTARQLARFNEERFQYRHLQHVVGISTKFASYLSSIHGLGDEELAREQGIR